MRAYVAEQPLVLTSGPTYDLAKKVADWIEDPKRRESKCGWVAGVYGGRGTGKTSFLMTLAKLLADRAAGAKATGAPPTCNLPAAGALLAPADTRDGDELLFLVLDHLEKRDEAAPEEEFKKARTAEVQRKDLRSFIEYQRDVTPSMAKLPEALVSLHSKVAATTTTLKDAFHKIVKEYTLAPGRTLPLFVDDIDLQPQRALELLEIAHLFLNHPGVVVVVTADRDLLLHAIQRALEKRGLDHPGLATALLAKYVPYEWSLPTPSERERVDILWGRGVEPDKGSEVAQWWQDDALIGLREARAVQRREYQDRRDQDQRAGRQLEPERREEEEPPPDNARKMVVSWLLPMLPVTYRGIKAVHNRLASWRERLDAKRPTEASTDFRGELQQQGLGINRYLVAPFFAMLVVIDVRWPELGLLALFERSPAALVRTFSEIVGAKGERPDDLALLGLPPHKSPLSGDLGEAKRTVHSLAHVWRAWQRDGAGAQGPSRFLVISVNRDALAASEVLWRPLFSDEEVAEWHLDLRSLVSSERPQPADIKRCREATLRSLNSRLARFAGRVEIYASAPLSFLLWLGWMLDDQRQFTIYNARTKVQFGGPAERLFFPDRGLYEDLEVKELPADDADAGHERDCALLINLTGAPGRVDDFHQDGIPVRCGVRRILQRRTSAPIVPDDLVPMLRDVLELLGQLHRGGVRHLHLALAGPDVVAFFLGRQLKATGMRISLYELYGDRHEYVFDLEEPPSGDG